MRFFFPSGTRRVREVYRAVRARAGVLLHTCPLILLLYMCVFFPPQVHEFAQSIAQFARVLELRPAYTEARANLERTRETVCEWEAYADVC